MSNFPLIFVLLDMITDANIWGNEYRPLWFLQTFPRKILKDRLYRLIRKRSMVMLRVTRK